MNDRKFSVRAEQVLRCAQAAAGELGHGYVGCEHLLLAMLREEGDAACRALNASGVYEKAMREMDFHNFINSYLLIPWFDIFENSGSRIVAVALMSIPANGNSRYPLLNAAKSFTPKYLLMKNWLAELIIKPYKLAVDIGFINLNISLIDI